MQGKGLRVAYWAFSLSERKSPMFGPGSKLPPSYFESLIHALSSCLFEKLQIKTQGHNNDTGAWIPTVYEPMTGIETVNEMMQTQQDTTLVPKNWITETT